MSLFNYFSICETYCTLSPQLTALLPHLLSSSKRKRAVEAFPQRAFVYSFSFPARKS